MYTSSLSSCEIIARMQQLVPPGSGEPQDPGVLDSLRSLTQDLIRAYQVAGRLHDDPFHDARTRSVHLYEAEIRKQLADKVVLVTGGEGCVGSQLITKLIDLGVRRIASVDKAAGESEYVRVPSVRYYTADIRDYAAQQHIFDAEQPDIVFHVAAQRRPGLAEKQIRETITSNVFGTQTIIRLCEEFGVQQCIFSSTGKASRYFTSEVYAASKKLCEWLFADAARVGRVRYGMVRFTHMLENSLMCQQINDRVSQGKPVNIHAPDRYVAGQNVGEAVNLLLNALVVSEQGRLMFLLVQNLGWPTESLEVALYSILQSGQDLPIYFQGVLPGYEESFFLGQVDWDDQIDINTLINALETSYCASMSSSGDMQVADLVPFSAAVLHRHLSILATLSHDRAVSEVQLKQELAKAVREIARSTFLQASPHLLLKILRWGVNPKRFHLGELNLVAYQDILELLVQSLRDRVTLDALAASRLSLTEFEDILLVLATLPSIERDVAHLQAAMQQATQQKNAIMQVA